MWTKMFIFLFGIFFTQSCFALSFNEARHLLSRTGFYVSQSAIEEIVHLTRSEAVDSILKKQQTDSQVPLPRWANEALVDRNFFKNASKEEKKQFQQENRQKFITLQAWWYKQMLATTSPLTERMTLFWHNHFTSSFKKVKSPQLLLRQNERLRQHALGRFSDLLKSMSFDPAMLVYLDNRLNKKQQPNENFARELLELFTLGEGQYSEEDVKAAARAFTGHTLNRKKGVYQFRRLLHDDGEKVFLGHRGHLDAPDILNILLKQPQTARFITAKIWKEFITTDISDEVLDDLAMHFFDEGYRIDLLLADILKREEFWSSNNMGTRIKSPAEMIVGTLKFLNISIENDRRVFFAGRQMGQVLFNPPNVKGWPGGLSWIDSDLLLKRQDVIFQLSQSKWARRQLRKVVGDEDNSQKRLQLQQFLLPIPPVNQDMVNVSNDLVGYVSALLQDPAYQLN